MRINECVDIARRLRIVRSWRRRRRGEALWMTPGVRVNARPLFVRLIENRREIHRTSDAGTLRTVVAADEACILNDELCAWRDRIGVIVHDRRKTIARCRSRGVRPVT